MRIKSRNTEIFLAKFWLFENTLAILLYTVNSLAT